MIRTEILVFFHTKQLFIVAIASCHYENWKLDKNSPSSIGLKKKKSCINGLWAPPSVVGIGK